MCNHRARSVLAGRKRHPPRLDGISTCARVAARVNGVFGPDEDLTDVLGKSARQAGRLRER